MEHYFSQCVIHKRKLWIMQTHSKMWRGFLQSSYFVWKLNIGAGTAVAMYTNCLCGEHMELIPSSINYTKLRFSFSLFAVSQQKRCVEVTLPFSISPSFTLKIGKNQQCVNGRDATKTAPGNLEKTAEEWLLRESLWSPPWVPSPGTSGMGDSTPLWSTVWK